MRLSDYTDYTLRVLMYCASHPERLVTIAEIAERHQVSKNHLMKVANELTRGGFLHSVRGRGGALCSYIDTKQNRKWYADNFGIKSSKD